MFAKAEAVQRLDGGQHVWRRSLISLVLALLVGSVLVFWPLVGGGGPPVLGHRSHSWQLTGGPDSGGSRETTRQLGDLSPQLDGVAGDRGQRTDLKTQHRELVDRPSHRTQEIQGTADQKRLVADNSFDRTVAPVLATHCLSCHSGAQPQGQLDLSSRVSAMRGGQSGAVILPGKVGRSLLWNRIAAEDMPPKHPLSAQEKTLIREWIAKGAPWGSDPIDPFQFTTSRRAGYDWWSLQPLARTPHPNREENRWSSNEIDHFILARLKRHGLTPSLRADPRVLVRRLSMDLIGLPPPLEVINKFASDPSPQAWEQLVDDLLASKHYGERWARHWMDVVRFGESDGYEYNRPRENSWHYRDWLIRAFNDDMPYDRFARMQLAGDLIKPNRLEGAAAVGFLVAGTHNTVLGVNETMKLAGRQDELEEIAGTVSQTFLGLTVNCARCHDHKFDPITTREYYRFIAALDGIHHGERTFPFPAHRAALRKKTRDRNDAMQHRLVEMIRSRKGVFSRTANQLRTKGLIEANRKGKTYRVSLKVAPSVWADAKQATSDRDGVMISILHQGGARLAEHVSRPGGWDRGRNATSYQRQSFRYTGNGEGPVRIHLRPFPVNSGRFGGAIDDLTIVEVASGQTVFAESFQHLRQRNAPGRQAHTGSRVFYGATSDRWDHSGINTIHAVEHSSGNLALQLFGGDGGTSAITAETPAEKKLQAEIVSLDKQLAMISTASLYTVRSRQPGVMRIFPRGDVTQLGEEVAPGGIAAIKNVPATFGIPTTASDSQRREKLANWITHRNNALFHRVAVNRIWHYHFGRGIVSSPSDFGFNGGRPSHPHLLDWLAVWFRDNGYSLKKLHKLIVMSATYQQASQSRPDAAQIDKSNRLLWRQNPRRIEAEVLRDSILEIAGELNRKQFGPGFQDFEIVQVPPAFYYTPVDRVGMQFNRRTIYRWNVRGQRSALLDTFDCPDPSTKTPKRTVTTTPSQALSLWNAPLITRMSEKLAERVRNQSAGDIDHQVTLSWHHVLGRSPSAQEKRRSVRLVRDHGLPLLCRVLFNSNEFLLID